MGHRTAPTDPRGRAGPLGGLVRPVCGGILGGGAGGWWVGERRGAAVCGFAVRRTRTQVTHRRGCVKLDIVGAGHPPGSPTPPSTRMSNCLGQEGGTQTRSLGGYIGNIPGNCGGPDLAPQPSNGIVVAATASARPSARPRSHGAPYRTYGPPRTCWTARRPRPTGLRGYTRGWRGGLVGG